MLRLSCSKQNRKAGVTLFAMNKITQDMHFKQVVIEYSFEGGVRVWLSYEEGKEKVG